jgi:hypothetical protein|eukprot:COSAG01_NODE_748_length_13852_cov_46.032502_6_plen_321_part_00
MLRGEHSGGATATAPFTAGACDSLAGAGVVVAPDLESEQQRRQIQRPAKQSSSRRGDGPEGLEEMLRHVPLQYREGPWSAVAVLYFVAFAAVMGWLGPSAMQSYQTEFDWEGATAQPESGLTTVAILRLLGAGWGLLILLGMCAKGYGWAIQTYTMQSWALLTVRLGAAGMGRWWRSASWLAELLRYPSIVQHSTVFIVWWLVLVPVIHQLVLPREGDERAKFRRFNASFVLVNVHLLNMFAAVLDFTVDSQPLSLFQLWVTLLMGGGYLLFYLLHCDAKGLHLYIIFTPRTPLCFCSYSGAVGLTWGLLHFWSFMASKL